MNVKTDFTIFIKNMLFIPEYLQGTSYVPVCLDAEGTGVEKRCPPLLSGSSRSELLSGF